MQLQLLLDLDVVPHLRLILLQHHLVVLRRLIHRDEGRCGGGRVLLRGHQSQARVGHPWLLDLRGVLQLREAFLSLGELLLVHHGVFLEAHVHEDLDGRLDVLDQRGSLRLPQLLPLLGEQILVVVVYL